MSNEQLYETLKLQLIDAGWKIYRDGSAKVAELPFYACRKSLFVTHPCELNERLPQLIAKLWHFYPGLVDNYSIPEMKSSQLSITGTVIGGRQVTVEVSCPWQDLIISGDLYSLDKMLSAAYDSAYTTTSQGEDNATRTISSNA